MNTDMCASNLRREPLPQPSPPQKDRIDLLEGNLGQLAQVWIIEHQKHSELGAKSDSADPIRLGL
jgi:hypothetical protein